VTEKHGTQQEQPECPRTGGLPRRRTGFLRQHHVGARDPRLDADHHPPHAPDYVRGVINLRGSVVPIVDLANRLGLGPIEPSARHVIIIAMLGDQTVGLLVEAVSDILTVPADSIQPTPEIASTEVKGFIEGVIAMDDRMIRMIELDNVLPAIVREAA
jgi:purine-binding chemotaxis protein CheW